MMEYKLIETESLPIFTKVINELMAEGWQLQGNTIVLPNLDQTDDTYWFIYFQAMTRETINSSVKTGRPPVK